MKKLCTLFSLFFIVAAIQAQPKASASAAYDSENARLRTMNMDIMFTPTFDADVERYIQTYLRNRTSSENLLGKTAMYYPYFEQALQKYNLPLALKNLPIVESMLNPSAISPAGAGGLWQFMPATGNLYGLRIGGGVDERYDPVRASEAAALYMQKLYTLFEDWEMVLAAYNCGPYAVMNAMKKAKATNYQAVKQFLPHETRQYVPRFVAACYLMQHFHLHELKPRLPELDAQLTQSFKIYKSVTFRQIEVATGVSQDMIAKLNPSYRERYVPANDKGNSVIVPRRVGKFFNDLMHSLDGDHSMKIDNTPIAVNEANSDNRYIKSTYTVGQNESISQLSEWFGCASWNIQMWNNLPYSYVYPGQEITVYVPRENNGKAVEMPAAYEPQVATATYEAPRSISQNIPSNAIIHPSDEEIASRESAAKAEKEKTNVKPSEAAKKKPTYKYYTIKKNDSLWEIAKKYDVEVKDLKRLNGIRDTGSLKPGTKIKVKEIK